MHKGALYSLVAYNYKNTDTNIEDNSLWSKLFCRTQSSNIKNVNYYDTNVFQDNKLEYIQEADFKCPEYLQISLNPTLERDKFKEHIYNICFRMNMGGVERLNIPLRFMIELNNYEICEDKFYIKIPFHMFFDDLKVITISRHKIDFKLINVDNIFTECSMISNNILIDNLNERLNMVKNIQESRVQLLQSEELNSPTPIHEFTHVIPFEGIHKGFFIECDDVDNISGLKLILKEHDRFNYSRFLVRHKCIKISQRLLYFPFNYNKSYLDRTESAFEGSINFDRINDYKIGEYSNVKLNVLFDNPVSKVCIYGLGSNKFIIYKGMTDFRYMQHCNNYHISKEYIKPQCDREVKQLHSQQEKVI